MRKVLCLIFLSVSSLVFAQGGARSGSLIKSSAGQAGTVRVCTGAATGTTCSPLATIYSDSALSNPIVGSIVTTDASGNYSYYCSAGAQLKEQSNGVTTPVTCPIDSSNASLKKLNNVRYADQFATIQAAITDTAGPVSVYIPCGTYTTTISIIKSDVTLKGGGKDCTVLKPLADGTPVITIDATSLSTTGLNHVVISDMTLLNTSGFTTSDGIVIKGRLDIDQPNDRHIFRDLYITGLRDNISIQGRTIWTSFQNVIAESAKQYNVNVTTSAVVNFVSFRDSRFALAQKYGIFWNNSNVFPSLAIAFDHVNVENNGLVGTLANCAGLYITGMGQAEITNGSYFENNCTTNPDGKGADVRLTGTYAQSVVIRDSLFQASPYSIYNDATQTTGEYSGNYLAPGSKSIHVATTHALSLIKIGTNYDNSPHEFIADGGGNDHILLTAVVNSSNKGTFAGGLDAGSSGIANAGAVSGATTVAGSGLGSFGSLKVGASGSTVSDSRELIQNAHSCGTTTTCANTANGAARVVYGTVALTSASPSTAVVSSITAFTSTTSYVCTLTNMTNAANNILKVVNTSTSSFTITGPNTVTDVIAYQCIGN